MKKVAFTLIAVSIATVFTACKNEPNDIQNTPNTNDLAVAEATTVDEDQFLYVTAPSGLTLRKFDNLNSDKLAVMPYGTRLKVLSNEQENTMTVGGIDGDMNKVIYNNKTGFAFNGFLSKFFPPEKGTNAKMYITDLKSTFPKASYAETTGGTASAPSNTQTVILPTPDWHEAFYVAQQLYDIPLVFNFPNPKGRDSETIRNAKKPEQLLESNIVVERKDNTLQKITYQQAAARHQSSVTISKEGTSMKIAYKTVVQ